MELAAEKQQSSQQDIELGSVQLKIDSGLSKLNNMSNLKTQDAASPMPMSLPRIPSQQSIGRDTPKFSVKIQRFGRICVLLVVIGFLVMGRVSVPDHDIVGVEDKVMDWLKFANDFINKEGHDGYRRAFQILCSLLVDLCFIITFAFWVLKGKSVRLPLTLGIFYIVRAVLQKLWFVPFPDGYWWYDPGFPSLVVPYGKGSDFFYSGHSGFLVICAKELHAGKNKKSRNFAIVSLIYTMLILMVYRIHYLVDIFAGVFFADWCFFRVDQLKKWLDPLYCKIMDKVQNKAFECFKKCYKGKSKPQEQQQPSQSQQPEQPEQPEQSSEQQPPLEFNLSS